jgi:hypothetical protein
MATFTLVSDADTTGVGGMDEIDVAPARVVEVFGSPASRGDGYKISGEFIFCDDAGRVYTLSDWKATNLWDPGFPTPDQYWAGMEPDELTISAVDDDVAAFKEWLLAQLTGAVG